MKSLNIRGVEVEVTEEVYGAYMRPEWREHYRERNQWRCRNERGVRCRRDCNKCELARLGRGPAGSDLRMDDLQRLEEKGVCFMEENESVEEIVIRKERSQAICDIILGLPKEERVIIGLLYCGSTHTEIAAIFGVSRPAMTQRIMKIRKLFKKVR